MSGDAREEIKRSQPRLYPAEKLARDIMRGVRKNRALIVAPASGRVLLGNVEVRTDANLTVGSADVIVQSVS